MYKERKIDTFFDSRKRKGPTNNDLKGFSKGNKLSFQPEVYEVKKTLTKSEIDKKLLEFDLDSRYGPSYGICRFQYK